MTKIIKETPLTEYDILENIGHGSFGSVHKAQHKSTHQIVAIKVMKKKFNDDCKEYKILSKIGLSNHIVELYATYLFKKEFYFVMEYMNGGNLYQFINSRREPIDILDVKWITTQILSALQHLHNKHHVFHRDLKPENLLIHDHLVVKLADFGLAANINTHHNLTEYVSTRWYRAPEVLLRGDYSYPIDLWAVGTIFFELYTLIPLFPGSSEIDQLYRISQLLGYPSDWKQGIKLAHKLGFQFNSNIAPVMETLSDRLKSSDQIVADFLLKLLQYDPYKRMNSTTALSHPFLNNDKPIFDLPIIPLLSPLHTLDSVSTTPTATTNCTITRSISDLSIPILNIPPIVDIPDSKQKKKHRLSLWSRKDRSLCLGTI